MSHLAIDRLAAMADETPTADEATHLADCWDCRAELAALRRLVRMAALAPLPQEPLSAWSRLAPQLRAEGILADPSRSGHQAPRQRAWLWRAAASLALVLGGAALGRVTAGMNFSRSGSSTTVEPPAVAAFTSGEDALRVLTAAQQQYQRAAAFLAAQDPSSRFIGMNQDTYQARLAALDEIAAAARAGLFRAPQDPMLNQYYLTTLGAREATLRQIGATLPETRRLERY